MSIIPAWISKLTTGFIANDLIAADINDTFSYAGLEKMFGDLIGSLKSTGSTLTAAEMSDLKTIAANLNNGVSTSSYLTNVVGSLVNGSAMNATWSGGGAAVALGNLVVGATATQLAELNGKWFLGTDLPSTSVSMSGYATFSATYSASAKPLFGANGPSITDVNQGYLGDCYLEASLAEVASQNPNIISQMFTDNGNNSYGVRFFVNGVAEYVTVNNVVASQFNHGADLWATLAEKAYAQLADNNSWGIEGSGGYGDVALEAITGASRITDFYASGNGWSSQTRNSSGNYIGSTSSLSSAIVLSELIADLAAGDDVEVASWSNHYDSGGKLTLVGDHEMSIYGYDATTGLLEVRNPWGGTGGTRYDVTFEVSLETLLADGDYITTDNAGSKLTAPISIAAGVGSAAAPKEILASFNTVNLAGNDNVSVIGVSDVINLAGLGNNVKLTGSSQTTTVNGLVASDAITLAANTNVVINGAGGLATLGGAGDTLTASGINIASVANATGETINGSNDKITLASGFSGTINGAGDAIKAADGDNVTLGGNGRTGATDSLTLSKGTVHLNANSRMDVYGANDTIVMGNNSTAGVWGDNNKISAGSGAEIWFGGVNETVTASGATLHVGANSTASIVGGADLLIFGAGFGHASINGFANHTTGSAHDTFSLAKSDFANFATLLADAKSSGADTIITAANGDQLTLMGVSTRALAGLAADFTFHA